MNTPFSDLQRDALQELLNIAMGQAANALARLIQAKITLSIPKICMVSAAAFQQMFANGHYWVTRQSFLGAVKGEVLTLLARDGTNTIAGLLDYSLPLDERSQAELLHEVANILAGACLNGMATQLSLVTKLSMPTIFHAAQRHAESFRWSHTLLLEVDFQLEGTAFDARIVMCLEPQSVNLVIQKLDLLLGD